MGIELSAEDRAGLTADEIAILTATGAEDQLKAYGGSDEPPADTSTGADADDTPAAPAPAPAAEGAPAASDSTTDETLPGADDLEALLDDDAPAATAAPQPFKVEGPADFKAERQALRDQKAAIEAKWGEGELSDAERAEQLLAIDDQIDDLLIAHTRATTLREQNQQTQEREANAAVNAIIANAKKDGTIDYLTDQKAGKQFDQFLNLLAADPDNAGKTQAQLMQEAHNSVLALRGIAKGAAPSPSPTTAPAPPARRNVPTVTLAGMPPAAPVGMDGDVLEKFALLEGDEAEAYFEALPKAQQERITRAADAGSMTHTNDARTRRARTA